MTRQEMAGCIAQAEGVSISTARSVIDRLFNIILAEVDAGKQVQIRGFGTFDKREYAARTRKLRNQSVDIPARKRIVFRASPATTEVMA